MKEIILNFYLNQNSEFCLKTFFRVPLHFRSFTLSTWQFSRKTTTNAKQWPNRSSKFWRISKIKSPNVKKGERLHSKIEKIVSSNYSFQATFFKKKTSTLVLKYELPTWKQRAIQSSQRGIFQKRSHKHKTLRSTLNNPSKTSLDTIKIFPETWSNRKFVLKNNWLIEISEKSFVFWYFISNARHCNVQ